MLRVKNMHPWSPSDPSRTAAAEAKPRCVHLILKPHGQSSRCQVRLLPPRRSRGANNLNNYFDFHVCLSIRPSVRPSVSVRVCVQKNLSEFQMPSHTAHAEAKPRCVYSILKPHGQSSIRPVRPLLSKATPSYVYSILKPHGQNSRSPVRLLLSEATLSYVYSILKPPGHSYRSRSDCC